MHKHIQVHTDREVTIIEIARPDKLNALTQAMRLEVAQLIREHGRATGSRGIVITGAGAAFSAGEDLTEARVNSLPELLAAVDSFHDITRAILESWVPVVAAVNGLAVGGASEIAFSCDARVGSDDSAFMLPENRIGLTSSNGSSMFLQRLLGPDARRLVLESSRVGAAEACTLGLLDALVPAAELQSAAAELALRWNPVGGASSLHLKLLRPTLEDYERAVERENAVAALAWEQGIIQAGLDRFWSARSGTEDAPPLRQGL